MRCAVGRAFVARRCIHIRPLTTIAIQNLALPTPIFTGSNSRAFAEVVFGTWLANGSIGSRSFFTFPFEREAKLAVFFARRAHPIGAEKIRFALRTVSSVLCGTLAASPL